MEGQQVRPQAQAEPVARLVANISSSVTGARFRLWMRSMIWSNTPSTAGWFACPRLITPGCRYLCAWLTGKPSRGRANGTTGAAGRDCGVGDGLTGPPLVTRGGGEG